MIKNEYKNGSTPCDPHSVPNTLVEENEFLVKNC